MSKKISLLIIALVLVFALPVFAQDDPYADVDPSGQTIYFWHQHTDAREEQLQEIVSAFNESNEWGITVIAENQGGYGDIFQKINLGLTAGGGDENMPELTVAYMNQALTYDLVDGVVDLNTLVDSPTWGLTEEDKADFFESFYNYDVSVFDGQRLGFPPNRSMEVMYFNADWLAELSASGAISFEGAPVTPEQFEEAACAAVENPFSGATGDTSTSVGYQLSFDASRFASWAFAFDGDMFDYEAVQYDLANEGAVASMQFLQDLFEAGCATDIAESFGDQSNFGAGVTLFTVGSSSGLPFYRSAVADGANFDWSVAPLPHTTEEPVMNVYGASVSIPRTTPEKELAAWLFVKYYTSDEVQAGWAEASNYFPVRASVADGLTEYFESDPAYKAAFDLLQYGYYEPAVPGYDFVRTLIAEKMAEIMADPEADITAILEEANVEANEILADNM